MGCIRRNWVFFAVSISDEEPPQALYTGSTIELASAVRLIGGFVAIIMGSGSD
jgi:hypothetical protein